MIEVVMPQLGESVAEGTVTKWLVREGDYVTRDQTLLEVATDKADTEIPAPASGVVVSLAVPVGTVVAKQGLLCTIDETAKKAESKPAEKAEAKSAAKPAEKPAEAPRPAPEAKPGSANGETAPAASLASAPLTTPSTRKLAHEMGVDINRVQATGERGRVTRDDVVRAVGQSSPPPPSRVGTRAGSRPDARSAAICSNGARPSASALAASAAKLSARVSAASSAACSVVITVMGCSSDTASAPVGCGG